MPKRAALYIRVSSEEQARHGLSLGEQRKNLMNYAQEHGYVVVGVYADEGVSARKAMSRRKELQRMLADADAGRIDIIIIKCLDRWFRNVADFYKVKERLDARGVDWVCATEDFNTTTPNGLLMLNLKLSLAQHESDQTGERIKYVFEGKRARKEVISGSLPIGLKVENKHAVPDERLPIVRFLFDYVYNGGSMRSAAIAIQEKFGVLLSVLVIRNMLKNRSYIGEIYGIPDYIPALIPHDVFFRVQDILSRNAKPTPSGSIYLFTGLIRCPVCGKRLSATRGARNRQGEFKAFQYLCKAHKVGSPPLCGFSRSVFEPKLENYLLDNIQRLIREHIVTLEALRVNGTITGGTGAGATGNTLAIHHDTDHTSYAGDFTGVQNLHFYLGESISAATPTLLQLGTTNKDITGIHVGVGVNGRAPALRVSDVISLMKVSGGTLTTDADHAVPPNPGTIVNHVEGMQGVSLLYGFDLMKRNNDELVAMVTKAAISEQAKSFVETRAAATDFINRGADLLAGSGIASAGKEAAIGRSDKDVRGYHLWAAMQQGGMETGTGSYVDTKGWNLSLGWAAETKKKNATITFGPFVEYGKGKYDSYLDDGTHGSGNVSYLGVGLLGRMENDKGLWAEAALHGGRTRSDYRGSIYAGSTSEYDSSNAYYAAHLGVGKEMKTNDKDKLNTYLRYFWSYQSGMQTDITTNRRSSDAETYDFGAVSSNRVRLGFTYTHRDSERSEVFAGLAWEYELSGKAGASYQGYDAPSPSLRGGSGMLEMGYRFAPKDSRFSYDLHFAGWLGKRQGYTGGAHMNWAF